METIAKICIAASYFTIGGYFLQMFLLFLFPEYEHLKDIPYDKSMAPDFFIVIPVLNEETVIEESVRGFLGLDMQRLRVIVIDDDSDDSTVENLRMAFGDDMAEFENDGSFDGDCGGKKLILLRRRAPQARLGKGASLNSAYKFISRIIEQEKLDPDLCIMSVMDADVFLPLGALQRVAVMMCCDKTVGMVQTRVHIGTSTRDYFLPRMQDLEFFVYINRTQNLREYTGTVAAAGNGQFNRFSAIDPQCPWTDCLLEDFDFSMRMLLKGWRTRLLQQYCVYQQGVFDYKSFVRQRSRWCQGALQCVHYLGQARRSKYIKKSGVLEMAAFLMLSSLTLLALVILFTSLTVIGYFTFTRGNIMAEIAAAYPVWELWALFLCVLFFAWAPGVAFGIWYYKDTKENFLSCILSGLFMPVYNLLMVPPVLAAFWRQFTGKSGWLKTSHK